MDALPLAVAASVIAIAGGILLLLTLRCGKIFVRLEARREAEQRQTMVERMRHYGQEQGSASSRRAAADREQ